MHIYVYVYIHLYSIFKLGRFLHVVLKSLVMTLICHEKCPFCRWITLTLHKITCHVFKGLQTQCEWKVMEKNTYH